MEFINKNNILFYNPARGYIKFNQVINEVFDYMKKDKSKQYEVVLGCDSSSGEKPVFPIVLIVLRKGEGGRFFITKVKYGEKESQRFKSLHERILREVYLSCELGLKFKEVLEKSAENLMKFNFQYIHADVGKNGKTKDMVKEVVGLIKSNGFEAKIKPESFAASVVADRFT